MAPMSAVDSAQIGVDLALFKQGLIKPSATHHILDKELYAQNQEKQMIYTEHCLIVVARRQSRGCKYGFISCLFLSGNRREMVL